MKHSVSGEAKAGFSEACERNKRPLMDVLKNAFAECRRVLEIGSGTGQHAVYFAGKMPKLLWQPTDQRDYLPGLTARLQAEACANVLPALELDVRMQPWPCDSVDAVFSANTLHYMGKDCVAAFFRGVGAALLPGGSLVVYGPFRYQQAFTSESNAQFDAWLRAADPARGIRDFEWIAELAAAQQLELKADIPMPANNQCLVWVK